MRKGEVGEGRTRRGRGRGVGEGGGLTLDQPPSRKTGVTTLTCFYEGWEGRWVRKGEVGEGRTMREGVGGRG